MERADSLRKPRTLSAGYWQVGFDRLNHQAGVDSAWEQYKLEARKMLVNAGESPAVRVQPIIRRFTL